MPTITRTFRRSLATFGTNKTIKHFIRIHHHKLNKLFKHLNDFLPTLIEIYDSSYCNNAYNQHTYASIFFFFVFY